jgi:hypothetical protein
MIDETHRVLEDNTERGGAASQENRMNYDRDLKRARAGLVILGLGCIVMGGLNFWFHVWLGGFSFLLWATAAFTFVRTMRFVQEARDKARIIFAIIAERDEAKR